LEIRIQSTTTRGSVSSTRDWDITQETAQRMISQDSSKLGQLKEYHANKKKTPQGVTNVEVILFNHLMQERWKRANGAMERILIPLKWQTQRIYNLRIIAMSFVENL
jgi:hypothetical protein